MKEEVPVVDKENKLTNGDDASNGKSVDKQGKENKMAEEEEKMEEDKVQCSLSCTCS